MFRDWLAVRRSLRLWRSRDLPPNPVFRRMISKARWTFNRLRCMDAREIPFRVWRLVCAHAQRLGLGDIDEMPQPDIDRTIEPWIRSRPVVDADRYVNAADRIVSGRFDVFNLHDIWLGSPPQWNSDPRTGREAPLSFGKLLNYRDPAVVGDIKYLWEPNRHMHLVTLAQAFSLTGDRQYVNTIWRHLESWWSSCPYRMGPNWSSSLEAAIRLINWAATWQLLGGAHASVFESRNGTDLRSRWLRSVYQHARFVIGHLSQHSSANNHLIGEAVGLYVASQTWPHWPEARRWRNRAAGILERETLLQNAPDGVNREQAISYQQFEIDLLLVTILSARSRGDSFSAEFESRVVAAVEFIVSLMDVGGNVPMIGDSDDGMFMQLSREPEFCRYRALLASAGLYFRRSDWCAKAGRLDDKSRWLFGEQADEVFNALASDPTDSGSPGQAYRDGGYYILGTNFDHEGEIRIVFNAGPLGYGNIAAHGHADSLAFTLSLAGREMLVDSGTYSYHTDARWRAYFRGTSAHNTLRIDGRDQSESGGSFMWIHKANTACRHWQNSPARDVVECWHDGYSRLSDPVYHGRRMTLDKVKKRIVIEDFLCMTGSHDIELFFHCSESCFVETRHNGYGITCGDRMVELTLPRVPGAQSRIHYGDHTPICGWISRSFGHKEPSPTIVWRARQTGNCVLTSELRY